MKCWIITEGMAGTENQCIGVAESLGVAAEIKRVSLKNSWRILSPWLRLENAGIFTPPLLPPWPDLLITSGRKSIAAARFIKRASGGKAFTVFIQDPRIPPENFDLVAVPDHDSLRGKNVIVTMATPNRVTDEKLAAAKKQFPEFIKLKSPRVAVLIGGNSKSHRLTAKAMQKFAMQLKNLDAGLMITASRRTGEENRKILEDNFLSAPDHYLWNGTGENPYFGMLAWADYILVTADSASMLSDAGTTGKPVYIVPLEGGSPRLDKLHATLKKHGIARDFTGKLENWTYEPLRDSQKIADEIRARLSGHIAGQV